MSFNVNDSTNKKISTHPILYGTRVDLLNQENLKGEDVTFCIARRNIVERRYKKENEK